MCLEKLSPLFSDHYIEFELESNEVNHSFNRKNLSTYAEVLSRKRDRPLLTSPNSSLLLCYLVMKHQNPTKKLSETTLCKCYR